MDSHTNGDHNRLFEGFGEVKGILRGLDEKLDFVVKAHEANDKRLHSLERDNNKAKGIAIASGFFSSIVMGVIGWFIPKPH